MKTLSTTPKVWSIPYASKQPLKKNLALNFLCLLVERWGKALIRIEDYFAGMNIPYDSSLPLPPWRRLLKR